MYIEGARPEKRPRVALEGGKEAEIYSSAFPWYSWHGVLARFATARLVSLPSKNPVVYVPFPPRPDAQQVLTNRLQCASERAARSGLDNAAARLAVMAETMANFDYPELPTVSQSVNFKIPDAPTVINGELRQRD